MVLASLQTAQRSAYHLVRNGYIINPKLARPSAAREVEGGDNKRDEEVAITAISRLDTLKYNKSGK